MYIYIHTYTHITLAMEAATRVATGRENRHWRGGGGCRCENVFFL